LAGSFLPEEEEALTESELKVHREEARRRARGRWTTEERTAVNLKAELVRDNWLDDRGEDRSQPEGIARQGQVDDRGEDRSQPEGTARHGQLDDRGEDCIQPEEVNPQPARQGQVDNRGEGRSQPEAEADEEAAGQTPIQSPHGLCQHINHHQPTPCPPPPTTSQLEFLGGHI
jgi:hypothetical protein